MHIDRVTTYQLNEGDLVLDHGGMLLRLTDRRDVHGFPHGEVVAWAFTGRIENGEEVADYVREFLGDRDWWTVQGNELAIWSRVRETP